jgi:hypothetical protein
MNVDHFFTIGTDHQAQGRPCEDYALSGPLDGGAVFGVVADGCSGAKAHTDVGARALAWAFPRALAVHGAAPGQWFGPGFQQALQESFRQHQYGGARENYFATVAGFVATPDDAAVYLQGDGAVALRYADGRVRLIELAWWDNTPFYLNYQLHPDLLRQFEQRFDDGVIEPLVQVSTTVHRLGATAPIRTAAADVLAAPAAGVPAGGVEGLVTETTVPIRERFALADTYEGHVLRFKPREEGIVAMAVLTDGVSQVGALPATDVVRELMAFKNHQGEFVKRRLLKALRELRREGSAPRDDLGMAAVWFDAGQGDAVSAVPATTREAA